MGLLFPQNAGRSENLHGAVSGLHHISGIPRCKGVWAYFKACVLAGYIIYWTPCKMKP